MTNDEIVTKPRLPSGPPERSRRIPRNYFKAFATGFLDFARNDRNWIRHSCFVIWFALTAWWPFAHPPPSAQQIRHSVGMIDSRPGIDLPGQRRQARVGIAFR